MAGIKGEDYINEDGERILTGGKLAAYKNLQNNPTFYKDIGRRGGSVTGTKGGFAHADSNPSEIGRKGGLAPRKRKAKNV